MKPPKGVEWFAPPFAIEARCVECRWLIVSGDPRDAACAHTLERGHDTVVSMIGHVLFTPSPASTIVAS